MVKEGRKKLWQTEYFAWTKDNWTSRGEPLDFTKHKYLVGIYQDQFEDIVFKKPAQTGITERLITEALWLPDQHFANSIYFFPTTGAISDMVQERVDQPLNSNEYLSNVNKRNKGDAGKKVDKVGLKKMSKGFIYFRGSNSYAQITSVPGDAIFVDELDRMTQENVPYFEKRLAHSKYKLKRWSSTPTYPDFGIDKKYKESDQREYFVICKYCQLKQTLSFFENVDKEKCIVICKQCKGHLIPWELEGEWIATVPEKSDILHGYYISPLLSPMVEIKKLVEQSSRSSDSDMQQFYNQSLGLAYEPKGEKITSSVITNCVKSYKMPFYSATEPAYLGVDVGRVLHYVVRTKSRLLDCGSVTDFLGGEDSLEYIINKFKIQGVVIDALPETRKVQELINKFKGMTKRCYYTGGVPKDGNKYWKIEKDVITTDRTVSLDSTVAEYRDMKIEVPENITSQAEFVAHMTSSIRVIKLDAKGNKRAEWVETTPDHLFHASNYAKLAVEALSFEAPEVFFI